MMTVEDILRLVVALLAVVIFLAAFLASRRRPTRRAIFLTAAFGVYVLKAMILSLAVYSPTIEDNLEEIGIATDGAFLFLVGTTLL